MRIRINNIEFRKCKSINKEPLYEIIKWQENIYFNKEQEYRDVGYKDTPLLESLHKDGHSISKSFFTIPETCFVLSWIKINKREPDIYLESIGSRLLDITKEEKDDFWKVYKEGNEYLYKKFKI